MKLLGAASKPSRAERRSNVLHFHDYRFDRLTGELRCRGSLVSLRPQATAALIALTETPGRLVGHDELHARIWGEVHVAREVGLHQVIRQLRRALGDDARDPTFIQTVTRLGYRFVAETERVQPLLTARRRRSVVSSLGLVTLGALGFPAALILLCILLAS